MRRFLRFKRAIRFKAVAGMAVMMCALGASSAAAMPVQDPFVPTPKAVPAGIDLRSPDSSQPLRPAAPVVDLRAPDASDTSRAPADFRSPTVVIERTAAPASSGFDWTDAAIGAALALALLTMAFGTSIAIRRYGRPSASLG